MRSILNSFINNFIIKRSRQHRVLSALLVLACVVTLGVFLRLKLIGISMTYDPKPEADRGGITNAIETIDNRIGQYYGPGKGFTINLYDYDAQDILYSPTGSQWDDESIKRDFLNQNIEERNKGKINVLSKDDAGNVTYHGLLFLPNGANFDTNNFPDYDNQKMTAQHYTGGPIALQGIVQNKLLGGPKGVPVLSADVGAGAGESLAYLFPEEANPEAGVTAVYKDVTGLFKQEENWIVFDSAKTYAYYLRANDSISGVDQFGVNDGTFKQNDANGSPIGFFPFNRMDENYKDVNANVGHYNHHFGMTMTADFSIYLEKKVNGQPMEFVFNGDDDLWVFIDGVLVLDIGGIHSPLGGSINFKNGDVTVQNAAQINSAHGTKKNDGGSYEPASIEGTQLRNLQDIFEAAHADDPDYDYEKDFAVGTNHTIKVFYMERGGVNSNLMIMTNIFERQFIDVVKKWEDDLTTHEPVEYKVYVVDETTKEKIPVENLYQDHGGATGILSADNDWHEKVTLLPVSNGSFHYEVEEVNKPLGYTTRVEVTPNKGSMGQMSGSGTTGGGGTESSSGTYTTTYALNEFNANLSWSDVSATASGDNMQLGFEDQWKHIFYAIPNEVKEAGLLKVNVKYADGTSSNGLMLKVYSAIEDGKQFVESYDSSGIAIPEDQQNNANYLAFMSLNEGNSTYTVSSLEFITENPVIREETFPVGQLNLHTRQSNQVSTNGFMGFGSLYGEYTADMPKSIAFEQIKAITVNVHAQGDSLAVKLFNANPTGNYLVEQHVEYNKTGRTSYSINPVGEGYLTNIGIMSHRGDEQTYQEFSAVLDSITVQYDASTLIPAIVPQEPEPEEEPDDMGDGFNVTYRPGSTYTIYNTATSKTEIAVNKKWEDRMGNPITPPDNTSITVGIKQYRTELDENNYPKADTTTETLDFSRDSIVLSADNSFSNKFEELPLGDLVGETPYIYSYSVYETSDADGDGIVIIDGEEYAVSYDRSQPIYDGNITITNTLQKIQPKDIDITIEKKWVNYSGVQIDAPVEITALLSRQKQLISFDEEGNMSVGAAETDTAFGTKKIVLGKSADSLSNTQTYHQYEDVDGEYWKYTYFVSEEGESEGKFTFDGSDVEYAVVVAQADVEGGEKFTITNKDTTHYEKPGESLVSIHKTIDSLETENKNDETNETAVNPDTLEEDDDLYRLYLDIESYAVETPVDLLLVVDQSGSMYTQHDIDFNGQNNVYRDVVLSSILNGSAEVATDNNRGWSPSFWQFNPDDFHDLQATVTDESLINLFLSLNPNNQLAVVGFDANRTEMKPGSQSEIAAYENPQNAYPYPASRGYTFEADSNVIRTWKHDLLEKPTEEKPNTGLNVEGKQYTGTNYEAGLMQAAKMLRDPTIQNNGHRKVMIFFSDGVPTCYIKDEEPHDRGGTTMSNTGSTYNEFNAKNVSDCVQPSMDAFDEFIKEFPQLTVYSVGLAGKELSETSAVLNYYTNNGGEYLFAGNDGNKLRRQLLSVLLPATPIQAVITDELSADVRLYQKTEDSADIKVTMRNRDGGDSVPIWENGAAVAGAGQFVNFENKTKDIVKSVNYVPSDSAVSTGTITVTFDEDYLMLLNQIYTVSYNVQVTEAAYEKLKNSGGYTDKGDAGTDYSDGTCSNATSSNKPGFFANHDAKVSYKFEGKATITRPYEHPVVQIETTDISVEKQWLKSDGVTVIENPVENVIMKLMRIETPVEEESSDEGDTAPEKIWVPVETMTPGNTYRIGYATSADNPTYRYLTRNDSYGQQWGFEFSGSASASSEWIYDSNKLSQQNSSGNKVSIYFNDYNGSGALGFTESGSEIFFSENHLWVLDSNNNVQYLVDTGGSMNQASNGALPTNILTLTLFEQRDPEPETTDPGDDDSETIPDGVDTHLTLELGRVDGKLKLTGTFEDLPTKGYNDGKWYKYTYYVVEESAGNDAYETIYNEDAGALVGKPKDGKVLVQNKLKDELGYLLPMTGGKGTAPYAVVGMTVILAGFLLQYKCRRKRERRSET